MSAIIERFRREHTQIISTLKEAKDLCVSSLPGHEKLMSVRRLLLDHLKAEDELLYPTLRDSAKGSERLRKLLEEFESSSREVSRRAMEFFDRYEMECSDIEFIREFALVMIMLMDRIAREEGELFQEFEHRLAVKRS